VMTGRLPAGGSGWLADHVVADTTLVPGAALVEWVLAAADEAGCTEVEELALQAPLVLPDSDALRVQVVVTPVGEDGSREVRVHSCPDTADGPSAWVCHATGILRPQAAGTPGASLAGQWPPAGAEPVEVADFYERATAKGYRYGPAFRGLTAVWRHGTELLAEVVLPDGAGEDVDGFGIHPALLDAALHPFALDSRYDDGQVWLPFAWTGVSLWATGARRVRVRLAAADQGFE
ncbi:polyketide synthase dehydratase domain-containing protein, partial [Streptomyces sp. MCAF7]